MDHLTTKQLIKIIKTHYKNGDSATATYRGVEEEQIMVYITIQLRKELKKFEETGVVIIVSLVSLKISLLQVKVLPKT